MREAIEQHFGNCKFRHKCLCTTKNSFEFTEEKVFFIYDEKNTEQPVRIVSSKDPSHLTITNQNCKLICLIKTDNCLLDDETRKCDCILFDDTKLFFIEIKNVNTKGRQASKIEAVKQLGITIELLKEKIDFSPYLTAAVICLKSFRPYITSASTNTARASFLEKHRVRLEEGNVIEF